MLNRIDRLFAVIIITVWTAATNGAVILDTGTTGLLDPETNWSLREGQSLAGTFTIAGHYKISSIQSWIGDSNLGSATVSIYSNNGGLPGVEMFSSTFTSKGSNSWQGINDLDWYMGSGVYWVVFDVLDEQTFIGTVPDTAIRRLRAYDSSNDSLPDDLGQAFRIAGDRIVSIPATLALFGIGLAGLGWSKRKKA